MPTSRGSKSAPKRSPRAPGIADSIREAILRGEYAAGVKLRQEELARRFATSVIPLREALHALAAEGLVEFLPNRGARVRPISSAELREMGEVRSALAAVGMRLAWPHLTPSAIEKARAISRRMDRARDPRARVGLYADFHAAILAPANRPFLVSQIRGIIMSGLRYMPVWLQAWKERGIPTTPGFEPVLVALERRNLADTLYHLKSVWAEQEDLVAEFLERRESGGAKTKVRAKASARAGKRRPRR